MAIEVGTKLEGKVTGITHFGAFIELSQGITGLVHISEIAENYVKDVKEHLKVDELVMVKVIHVDKDGKIGLSIKQASDKIQENMTVESVKPRSDLKKNYVPKSSSFGQSKPFSSSRPERTGGRNHTSHPSKSAPLKMTFEDKMSRFLKDSEERISSLKKNTESKRGGRGGRRD